MRCKRPARWSEDRTLRDGRDVLETIGIAGAALGTSSESAFPTSWFQEGEAIVPFTDIPGTRERVKSAIARVTRTPAGRLKIFGVARTEGTRLASVEVRIDSGPWQSAELDDRGNPGAWTFFTLETDPLAAGEHTLVSRATYWEDNAQFRRTIAVT